MMKLSQLLLAAAVLLTGCTAKEGDPGPAGATGPTGGVGATGASGQNLSGNVAGFLNVYSELGVALPSTAKAGFVVTVEGTTPTITATTSANGRFELIGVRNGTLNLLVQKPGYASQRRLGIVHAGGNTPTDAGVISLSEVSSTTIPSLTLGAPMGNYIPFSFLLVNPKIQPTTTTNPAGVVHLFFDTQPNITVATASRDVVFFYPYLSGGMGQDAINTLRLGYPQGTRVYVVAYGDVPEASGYSDLLTGRSVWTALNATPSPVVSFVMP